jgi:hypothetical protein
MPNGRKKTPQWQSTGASAGIQLMTLNEQ